MSKEYETVYDLAVPLLASDRLSNGVPGYTKAINVVLREDGLHPFKPNLHYMEDCVVYSSSRNLYIIDDINCEIFRNGEAIDSFSVEEGPWSFLNYGGFEAIISPTQQILYHPESDQFELISGHTLPPFTQATNFRQQAYGCDGTEIVYASAIGLLDFTIKADNEAGEIRLPAKVKAVEALGNRLIVFTEAGMYEVKPGVQTAAVNFYKTDILADTKTVWSAGRYLVYITNQGELVKLWDNGEGIRYGYKHIFKQTYLPFITGFYSPLDDIIFINNSQDLYLLTDKGLTQTDNDLFGVYPDENNKPVYVGRSGEERTYLQTHWFDFRQRSLDFLRACEVQGLVDKPFAYNLWVDTVYHRQEEIYTSKRITLGPNCQVTPMVTGSAMRINIEGPVKSFKCLHRLLLRHQRQDKTQIRGATHAG